MHRQFILPVICAGRMYRVVDYLSVWFCRNVFLCVGSCTLLSVNPSDRHDTLVRVISWVSPLF